MGFRNGAYAKVWELRPNKSGRSTAVRLSISKKDGNGGYEEDFSHWVMFIATANERAKRLQQGDRVQLGDVDVSARYDKEKRAHDYSFKVFSFEEVAGNGKKTGSTKAQEQNDREDGAPDDLPF